ncbi:transposase family protein [Actinomadura sp. WMMB 499]|nr:transposase family protein [Actinomadura sp. WMMB 499]
MNVDEYRPLRARARCRQVPVACPGCAVETAHVHAWCERTVADLPVDGRPMVMGVKVRRLACRNRRCLRQTFRGQVAGVLERYQRRTARLAVQVGVVVRELAGRGGTRVVSARRADLPSVYPRTFRSAPTGRAIRWSLVRAVTFTWLFGGPGAATPSPAPRRAPACAPSAPPKKPTPRPPMPASVGDESPHGLRTPPQPRPHPAGAGLAVRRGHRLRDPADRQDATPVGHPTWNPIPFREALEHIDGIRSERLSRRTPIKVEIHAADNGRWIVCMMGDQH